MVMKIAKHADIERRVELSVAHKFTVDQIIIAILIILYQPALIAGKKLVNAVEFVSMGGKGQARTIGDNHAAAFDNRMGGITAKITAQEYRAVKFMIAKLGFIFAQIKRLYGGRLRRVSF